ALKQLSGGKYSGTPIAGVAASELPIPTGPTYPAQPRTPVNPVSANPTTPLNPVTANPRTPVTPVSANPMTPVTPVATNTMTQVALLARQAYNQGSQAEASALLNSIDAEKLTMKRLSAEKSFDAAVQAHGHKDFGHALSVCVLIDPNLLPAEKKARMADLMATC